MPFDNGTHLVNKILTGKAANITARIDHEQRPTENKHQQGYRCLIHLCHALKRNEQIAHHEHDDNRYSKNTHFDAFTF